jgi:glycosyltransferase involved in cell wall biosynthesis
MRGRDTCVVIPVYNEAPVLKDVLTGVQRQFRLVVCVDDGSSDGSASIIEQSGAVLVRHPVNLGQGGALQTGVTYGLLDPDVRYFVTYDADGQHQLADVVRMLSRLQRDDLNVVFGSRFLDDRTSVTGVRRLVLKLAVRYTRATTGVRLSDAHNGLRVFDRSVAEALDLRQAGMAHASEFVTMVGRYRFRYAEEPVHILYTDYSRSKGQHLLNSVNILFDLLFR